MHFSNMKYTSWGRTPGDLARGKAVGRRELRETCYVTTRALHVAHVPFATSDLKRMRVFHRCMVYIANDCGT